jgi:glycosyltransferase involved in cell wall biosynthesis
MTRAAVGVTFVVPVHNGRRGLRAVLDGILAQSDGRPFEIVAVDDGSDDGSLRVLREYEAAGLLRVVHGSGRGAAAAINTGIREAAHPIVCQIDQDVVVADGWLPPILAALDDPAVAAAQGHYVTPRGAGFWASCMGRDLEHRYARIPARFVNHVCTGNTAYRASALHQVGLLDETLGYGYDNDLSYRLARAGYRLAFCRNAISVHRWREDFSGYLRQQFGVGYGRLDVVWRHPARVTGDDVSDAVMMAHAPAMLVAVVLLMYSTVAWILGAPAGIHALVGSGIVMALLLERAFAGVAAWRATGDRSALGFAVAHLARDLAWAAAIVMWTARRAIGTSGVPTHSMQRRTAAALSLDRGPDAPSLASLRLLAVVPAFNEAPSLPHVVAELRRAVPAADILVVNDGSTDRTSDLLPALGVQWLTLAERVGVGGAVRVGLRYAHRAGYQYVARLDGDGQHRAADIIRLLAPVLNGHADAVLGSRFLRRSSRVRSVRRFGQAALAGCLTRLTGRRVTDPTSGFWLFGPRAVRLLARHHPTGYPEPELVLLLSRNALRVAEVPIRVRRRLAGRTTITTARAALATARTLLALLVVPLRDAVEGQPRD